MQIVKVFDQTVPLVSGYSIRSRYITDSLYAMGVPVRVFSSPIFKYGSPLETIEGIDYVRTQQSSYNHRQSKSVLREFNIVRSLRATMRREWSKDSKLIHAHSSVLNGIASRKIAREQDVPFLYESRAFWEDAAVDQGRIREGGMRYKLIRGLETRTFKQADHVTVICEGLKKDVVARGIDPDKITVVPNGVDVQRFHPVARNEELTAKLGLKDKRVFAFIGTLFRFEGMELLVEATKQLVSRCKNAHLLIVGSGEQEKNLQQMVVDYGLSDFVTFTGRVSHDVIMDYYSVADAVIYPRLPRRITELVTPLKPLEAMAMKKIVISSDVGGMTELVQDGYNGLLFKAGDADDLVEKCCYAFNNDSKMAQMVEQAREYVVRERSWPQISEGYMKLYRSFGIDLPQPAGIAQPTEEAPISANVESTE